jgi:catechol 2,3-dioxygenase
MHRTFMTKLTATRSSFGARSNEHEPVSARCLDRWENEGGTVAPNKRTTHLNEHRLVTSLTPKPMNIAQLTTPNNRNLNSNGRHSIFSFDRRAARPLNGADRRRTNHREKTRNLRLGHVHLKVRDLNRSVPFYTRMLSLRLTEWVGRYAFFATGSEHHSIALEEIGDWAVSPSRRAVGVAHVTFQVADRAAFTAMQKKLRDAEVPFISGNNGTSWVITFKDPDGNEIEVYVDRRHSPGGSKLWKGRWYGPLQSEDEPAPLVAAAA